MAQQRRWSVTDKTAAKVSRWWRGAARCENGCGGEAGIGRDGRCICSSCRQNYKVGGYQKNQHNRRSRPSGSKAVPSRWL